jgi:hypothetical protein
MAGRLMDKVEKMWKEEIMAYLEELRNISESFSPGQESKGVLSNTS